MRAQSAMEYLMTYGWALVVVVVALAVLLYIFPLSPPVGCRFDGFTFTCENPILLSRSPDGLSNLMYVDLQTSERASLQIVGMACTRPRMPELGDDGNFKHPLFRLPSGTPDQPLYMTSGDNVNTGRPPSTRFRLQCVDVDSSGKVILARDANGDGRPDTPGVLKAGQSFSGVLTILYRFSDDDRAMTPRQIQAKITAQVQ